MPLKLYQGLVLGAGVILRRGNDSIAGLTTAAMIWGASGIGIAVGAGFYIEAIFGMCFLMISVELIPLTMKFVGPRSFRQRDIAVKLVVRNMDNIPVVIEEIKEMDIKVKNMKLKTLENGSHYLHLKLCIDQKDILLMFTMLSSISKVFNKLKWKVCNVKQTLFSIREFFFFYNGNNECSPAK